MGWGFQNKNLHKGIDSCNTNSASAVDVVGEEVNAKNFSNNKYLAPPPPPQYKFPLLKCLHLQGGGYSTGGGFTLIETVVGLALVSISGFVVTFISGQMNTASKLTDDSYECAAIATNVMERFSQGGLEPIVLLNSEHFPGTPPTDFEAAIEERSTISVNTSGEATHNAGPNLVIEPHGSNSHITLKVDKFHRGSGVSLVEDLFNEYRSTICPSNVDNLTFDLANDMVITYKAGNTAKLIDLHKKLDDVKPATPGPEPDYYKEMADANLSSNNYAWDTFTSEYLYGLSKSLKNALNLHLLAGFTDYSTSYTNTAQPYDVKIGIRPWSLSNRSALGCTDTKVHPAVFLRPGSKYDRYITDSILGTNELERQNKIGYKLERSLTSAKMRSDVGLKLFVEVKTRPGVDKLERSCKSNKLFAYANSFAVPPSRRPVYVHHDREIKDGSNDFIASTTHPLQNNPGLNVGYKYGAADSIPTKPDGATHATLSDYATEATLNFRNIGKVWRDVNNPSSFADDEEDFRGVFLCGFEKNRFEDCVKGPPDCDDIPGLSSYRTFGTNGAHKAGIRSYDTEYGSRDGSVNSSRRWDLCENFKLTPSQSNNSTTLKASASNVDDGKLGLELDNLNVSSWPDEDQDADYRVRFKLVDEYGNDYSATENGQIQEDDYTEEHRVFAYNCAQFGNTHASGSYQNPPIGCGVINPDPNIAKYNRRIDNPFYNTQADCEHQFNLLSSPSAQCVKVTNIRVYNDYFDDSIEERTGPANSPVRPVNGTGVTCDYWVEQCVKDGTACVQCGQGYMRDYPNATRQSCHGGSASLGGVTCYKAGSHCCHNDYGSFNCFTGKDPCSNPNGCGFNQDPTCGATCGDNGHGCNICTGATPCNTAGCDSCSFGTAGVCQYKCSFPTQYCDGASNCVECLNDGHCGGNDICCSYSCKAPCSPDSDQCEECASDCASPHSICGSGEGCNGSGCCVELPPWCNPACTGTDICCGTGTCQSSCAPLNVGACTSGNTPPPPCPGGQIMCGGSCRIAACNNDNDCNSGETCQNGGSCTATCAGVTCGTGSMTGYPNSPPDPGCGATSRIASGVECWTDPNCTGATPNCCGTTCQATCGCTSDPQCSALTPLTPCCVGGACAAAACTEDPNNCVTCPTGSCGAEVTCTPPQVCNNSTCEDPPPCTSNGDCADPTKPNCCPDGTCQANCGCSAPEVSCTAGDIGGSCGCGVTCPASGCCTPVTCPSGTTCDGNGNCITPPQCTYPSHAQCSGTTPCCSSSGTCGSATCTPNPATCTTCNPDQCGTPQGCSASTPNCCDHDSDPNTAKRCQASSCGGGGPTCAEKLAADPNKNCLKCTNPSSTTEDPSAKADGTICGTCGTCSSGSCNEPATCPCSASEVSCSNNGDCGCGVTCPPGGGCCTPGPATCTPDPNTCTTCPVATGGVCGPPQGCSASTPNCCDHDSNPNTAKRCQASSCGGGGPTCAEKLAADPNKNCLKCTNPSSTTEDPSAKADGTSCGTCGTCSSGSCNEQSPCPCSAPEVPCSNNGDCGCGVTCPPGGGCCTPGPATCTPDPNTCTTCPVATGGVCGPPQGCSGTTPCCNGNTCESIICDLPTKPCPSGQTCRNAGTCSSRCDPITCTLPQIMCPPDGCKDPCVADSNNCEKCDDQCDDAPVSTCTATCSQCINGACEAIDGCCEDDGDCPECFSCRPPQYSWDQGGTCESSNPGTSCGTSGCGTCDGSGNCDESGGCGTPTCGDKKAAQPDPACWECADENDTGEDPAQIVITCDVGNMTGYPNENNPDPNCNAEGRVRTECGITCHSCKNYCPSTHSDTCTGAGCDPCEVKHFVGQNGIHFDCYQCNAPTCANPCGPCEDCINTNNPPSCETRCHTLEICCSNSCRNPDCRGDSDCDQGAGEICDNPGTCMAKCITTI